ncbi:DNA ligase D [Sphingobacterium sp. LRF_L2]|uniref:DNA ligase D n=1 Tax=Sphingobacterium sp. LRF_L2 TaxID=3369421 RepID=UPI003F648A4C
MALSKYKKKRDFKQTPEPKSGKPGKKSLRFVVQKHDARALHYDFRLEMDGVLKSWAVPKGPSLNPKDKRLAMMTEDHPYDYKDFEGSIPAGNYGAGEVIVWDAGTYEPISKGTGKKSNERLLLKELAAGSLKFVLHGEKLKGEFALVQMRGKGDNAWLLIKHNDDYAGSEDITKKDRSVKTNKTLADLKQTAIGTASLGKEKNAAGSGTTKVRRKLEVQLDPNAILETKPLRNKKQALGKATTSAFPKHVKPMLATLTDRSFDDDEWEFEVKWDGYRAIACCRKEQVQLRSRNDKSFNEKYYPIVDALQDWDIEAVLDGEVVVLNDEGLSDFAALQNWREDEDGTLYYYVFDILWYNGKNVMGLPLRERKAILQSIVPKTGRIRVGYSVSTQGTDFYLAAQQIGLEGIIAKRSDSRYLLGKRTRNWLKVKVQKRQEVVIAGYTKNEGSSKLFSSLLLAVYEGKKLRYVGKVGTGFTERKQRELLQLFKPLQRKTSPFKGDVEYNKATQFRPNPLNAQVTWLRPTVVCEINFSEVTADGVFRHPAFIALREDKAASTVTLEKPRAAGKVRTDHKKDGTKGNKKRNNMALDPTAESQILKIGKNELKLTNLSKAYWPKEKYTKRDLLQYYEQMSPFILPYLKGRPLSLNRFPDGIEGDSFYQKDVTGKVPDWIELFPYEADGEAKNYMMANGKDALLYMVNLGTIELNPWFSTAKKPDYPTYCVLDLDPDKNNTFGQVIDVARTIHSLLSSLAIDSYCKTSGSTGLHIYIPLGQKYTYEQSQLFARYIAGEVHQQMAETTSVERMLAKRKGKIYIDFLQNKAAATLASPYSVRPKPAAPVSMPLHWEEVKKGLRMTDFTIENSLARVEEMGDIFKPVLGRGIDLKKLLKELFTDKED